MNSISNKNKKSILFDYTNNLILVAFFITLFLLIFVSLIYLIPLIAYTIYLYIKQKKILLLSCLLSIIIGIIYLIYEYDNQEYLTIIQGKIIDASYYADYSKYILYTKGKKVLLYDYDNIFLNVGDIVYIKGSIKDTTTAYTPNAFDYTAYLKYKHIFYALVIKDYKVIDHQFALGSLRQVCLNYFNNNYSQTSSSFLKALLVGYSDSLDSEFYDSLKANGIIHLFAISGLHVSFFTGLIDKGLTKIKAKETIKNVIIIAFLIIYVIVTNFSASILRTSIMYVLTLINKKKSLNFSSLDICSISFIFLIIINPMFMYNNGFVLSYVVSFTIILTSPLIKDYSNNTQVFIISLVAAFTTLPIVININYEINLLTPIINVLFIALVTVLILPLSIMSAIYLPLDKIYSYVVQGFLRLSLASSSYFNLSFRLPKFSPVATILYYLLLFTVFITNKKGIKITSFVLLISYLLALNNINLFKPYDEVYFLDVYYGESTVIFSKFKDSVVIIDTGDGTNECLTNFLKSKGVKKIECLILTHNHSDHIGEVDKLKSSFKIEKIIISAYDDYNYGMNTTKVRAGEKIVLNRFSFDVLSPNHYEEEINDNSLVLYGKINDKHFLFMGDATDNIEKKIGQISVDILKVGHHGSNTSSNIDFLKRINPEVAIIMATRVKKFGFPRSETIQDLNKVGAIIYSTNTKRTIWCRYYFGQYYFYSLA